MICYPNVKINLGLNVLRKRPDSYHDLETLFYPYEGLCDCLEIVTGDDYSHTLASLKDRYGTLSQAISADGKLMITLAGEPSPAWDPLKDLCAKAYFLIAQEHKLPPMKIFLEKRSPVGAGLGGGSADAAFAIRMIDSLASLKLGEKEMVGYAAALGSDCAFFLYNRPMFGSGRGEILEDFPIDISAYRLEVMVPDGISVSTAEAYRGIVPKEPEIPLKEVLRMPVGKWKDLLHNDFEETVFACHPRLKEEKERMYERGAVYASMSGSGSALFALFNKGK